MALKSARSLATSQTGGSHLHCEDRQSACYLQRHRTKLGEEVICHVHAPYLRISVTVLAKVVAPLCATWTFGAWVGRSW